MTYIITFGGRKMLHRSIYLDGYYFNVSIHKKNRQS